MPTYLKDGKRKKRWRGNYTDINGIRVSECFVTEDEAIAWEIPRKEAVKEKKAVIENSKTPEEKRKKNLKKNGNNFQIEATATIKFCELLKNTYDFLQIRDGAHNDLALQFKSKKSNKYYALQIKSCSKSYKTDNRKLKDGSQNNTAPKASFSNVNKYPNSILVCILLKPFTIWIFHGEKYIHECPILHECGKYKTDFKNGLIYDEEKNINHLDKLEEYLTCIDKDGQDKYAQKEIEFWDLQIATSQYIENKANQLYQQCLNKKLELERRQIGELENQPHDLIENGQKIQEKVCCLLNHASGFTVSICKHGGKAQKGSKISIPYEEKDFDILRIYVLYILDKNNKLSFKRENYTIGYDQNDEKYVNAIKDIDSWKLFGYFEFPMNVLIEKKWVHTESSKGKKGSYVHLPKDIMKSLGLKLPCEIRRFTNGWTREYFKKIY